MTKQGRQAAGERRLGDENSEQRRRFVDAAEASLLEDGYKAVSARSIAAKAGLKPQLLYYYFRTMDDLMLAVVARVNERRHARLAKALASDRPLHAIWSLSIDGSGAALAAEMTSMAHHREAVRDEIVVSAQDFRSKLTRTVEDIIARNGNAADTAHAAGLVMTGVALARMVVTERALGFEEGHAPALALVEQLLDRLEPAAD